MFRVRMLLAMLLFAAGAYGSAACADTFIDSVYVDRTTDVLYIDGNGFTQSLINAQKPYVELNGQALQLTSYSNTSIEAALPAKYPDGDYQVFVSRSSIAGLLPINPHSDITPNEQASFSLSLVTPEPGPAGPAGPAGA